MTVKVVKLRCATQQYAWGKIGEQSEVAKLSLASTSFQLKESEPYAELWMGAHPKGPSIVVNSDGSETPLSALISQHPELLGSNIKSKFGDSLPFLFKVLSVNKALSIQAHPNKSHAEQLHKARPDKYPDPNHKPEMAIALTPFEGLCGFRPLEEIISFLKSIPELRTVIGAAVSDDLIKACETNAGAEQKRDALKKCFSSLMNCDNTPLQDNLSALVKMFEKAAQSGADINDRLGELFLRLHSQFPDDVGCFCAYFLNHVQLQPGEAMFLEANLPHAYLSGDCMECMACSDNVVRAGLTPKFKDVTTLCDMLLYDPKPSRDTLFQHTTDASDPYLSVYNPPVPDFAVDKIQLPPGVSDYTIKPVDSASILLVVEGEGQCVEQSLAVERGSVLFIAANQDVQLKVESGGALMFRAYCA